ncbi:MAG TPA: phosphodiesterase, partial [Gemmatimonadaceae bacterium]|nr:phosphodiesterase [Gemmatimonadaceae bacterium]
LLAREIILRRELIGLRYKQSDWEARRLFDPTTGLPGRDLFIERLGGAVRKAARYPDFHFAVLLLEIDQLKAIYQGLGREVAEELVRAVAVRIQPMVRSEELLARSPSEGFLILLEHIRDPLGATRVALRIQDALAKPVTVGESEMRVSASAGIVLSPVGLDEAERIVSLAGVARGRAQELGIGEFQIFEPQMQERVRARLDRETELRRAVEREEFEVFYQPLIDLQSGQVAELEALVRWNHPERGRLSAGEFIPLAEETDLILPLGWWVIASACPQMREWQNRFARSASLTLTVNVSARHLALNDFVDRMSGVVAASGIDPKSLHLEITESVLIRNPNDVRTKLGELRAGGMSVYLDDFGTGYSSLRYLSDLPLDGLKLDGSFVERITTVHTHAPIARTVRQLARDINVRAIAEGIETEEQLTALRALGYDRGQGYHIARPLSVSDVGKLLAARD